MKTSIWDILTGIVLLGILCMIAAFGMILMNPGFGAGIVSPAAAPTVARINIPSPTATSLGLPPTWTPTPSEQPTQKDASQPNLRPSSTPIPTNTVVMLPTFTPSRTPKRGTGGGSCEVVSQVPADNTTLTGGTEFDTVWVLKNTSSSTWRGDSVDIRFVPSGSDRVHKGNDVRDMGADVTPGNNVTITVRMAPASGNHNYVSNWSLSAGNTTLCKFYIQFSTK